MFQKFFVNNLASKFIKNLLATTNIPNAKLWKPGNIIVKNLYYFNDEGYLAQALENNSADTSQINFYSDRYFKIIDNYIPGEYIANVTSTYTSNSNNYDSLTHYNLGKYLRFLRDYNKIDLMSFYNCWCGEYSTSIFIKNNKIQDIPGQKSTYKTFLIPIVFNQKYSIFYSSQLPVKISPVYYDETSVLDISEGEASSVTQIDNIQFNKPYIYNGYTPRSTDKKLKEDYLYLMLQVPSTDKSGLVVLEGDYSNLNLINISTQNPFYNKLPDIIYGYKERIDTPTSSTLGSLKSFNDFLESDQNKYFISYPELLLLSDDNYAFSDRLLEFLLLNTISSDDNISDNIKRVQEYISDINISRWNNIVDWKLKKVIGSDKPILVESKESLKPYNKTYTSGIWDINMRKYLYDITKHNAEQNTCFDITGYVDKDVESIITRGANG